jgi:hypothetical protein
MTVRAVIAFHDIKEGVTRQIGDTFSVSEERYQELISTKFGKLVEKVAEAATKAISKKAKEQIIKKK